MNKKDINTLALVEKLTHGLVVLIFTLSLVFNYATIDQVLDASDSNGTIFLKGVHIIEILVNLLNIVIIFANYHYNYGLRNMFSKKTMEGQGLLFLVFIPAGIFNMAYETISLIGHYKANLEGYLYATYTSLVFATFVLLISFIVKMNSQYDYGEVWGLNLMNLVANEITVNCLVCRLLIVVLKDQMTDYFEVVSFIRGMADIETEDGVKAQIRSLSKFLSTFYFKFATISYIVGLALLVRPLRRQYSFVQAHKRSPTFDLTDQVASAQTVYPSVASVAFCSFSVAAIVTLMIQFAKEPTESTYLRVSMSLIYVCMLINTYFIYRDVTKGSFKRDHNDLISNFFLWLGLMGQFIQSTAQIQHAIHLSLFHKFFPGNFIIIVEYSMIALQSFAQNVLIASVAERNVQIRQHNSFYRFLSSPHYLFVLNILCFFLTLYDISKPMPPINATFFFVKLFENGFLKLGVVFALLHRAYAAIVMLDYFK